MKNNNTHNTKNTFPLKGGLRDEHSEWHDEKGHQIVIERKDQKTVLQHLDGALMNLLGRRTTSGVGSFIAQAMAWFFMLTGVLSSVFLIYSLSSKGSADLQKTLANSNAKIETASNQMKDQPLITETTQPQPVINEQITDNAEQLNAAAKVQADANPLMPPADLMIYLGPKPDSVPVNKRLFVFSDPDCPYCKKLEPMLVSLSKKGWSVTIFPSPVHESAMAKIASLSCISNDNERAAQWDKYITGGAEAIHASCDLSKTATARALAFFRAVGLNSTPSLMNGNGVIKVGATSEIEITNWINASLQEKK